MSSKKIESFKKVREKVHSSWTEADVEAASNTASLPDRLTNPEEYEPLLSTSSEHTAADTTVNKEPVSEGLRKLTPVYTYGSINWL